MVSAHCGQAASCPVAAGAKSIAAEQNGHVIVAPEDWVAADERTAPPGLVMGGAGRLAAEGGGRSGRLADELTGAEVFVAGACPGATCLAAPLELFSAASAVRINASSPRWIAEPM